MVFDYLCLYLHVLLLFFVILRECLRSSQRNLFVILTASVFLFLVSGQAWWMLSFLEENGGGGMMHLYQYVSLPAARLANLYVGIAVVCFSILYFILGLKPIQKKIVRRHVNRSQSTNKLVYFSLFLWVIGISIILTISAGGLIASLSSPGTNYSHGVTMLLILLSIGKLPLFYKIVSNSEITKLDVVLFLVVLLFTLLNARLNVALILLQLLIFINYCKHEISLRALLFVPVIAIILFIGFGLYREFASRESGVITLNEFITFIVAFVDVSMVINWFYAMNVEGFAGLAGVLTYAQSIGGLPFDFGVSNISFITQFIPGDLRTDPSSPLSEFSEFLRTIYPYEGSVVRPGMEIAYSNFGVFGIILFGALLAYLAKHFHHVMLSLKSSTLTLAIGLISVQSFHSIRGPFSNALFYGLSDLFMLLIFRVIFSLFKSSNFRVFNERSQRGHQ